MYQHQHLHHKPNTKQRHGPLPALTQAEVEEARTLKHGHSRTLKQLADLYGVSIKTMSYYINNPSKRGRQV
jgi:DNA-binding CsgD family transcriptional regulator